MSDDWDFYQAKVDHKPAYIFVNLGLLAEAPKGSYPYVSYLRLYMQMPRDDGLSSNEEFDQLCEIGDAVEAGDGSHEHIYVGRNTTDGTRDFYFYTSNPAKLKVALEAAMSSFPSYEYEIGDREDPDWGVYRDFLYPDARAMQLIQNRRVCESLEKHCDNLAIARVIDHRASFQDRKSAMAFESFLAGAGFAVVGKSRDRLLFGNHILDFERQDIPSNMDDVVLDLIARISELGGDYDGWGCTVENGS